MNFGGLFVPRGNSGRLSHPKTKPGFAQHVSLFEALLKGLRIFFPVPFSSS